MRPASRIVPQSAPSVAILTGLRRHRHPGNAQRLRTGPPAVAVAEAPPLVAGEKGDRPSRQVPLPHAFERDVVHGAILLSRAEMLEEVEAALRAGRPETREEVVADRRAIAVPGLVAGAGVVGADPRRRLQAGPQHLLLLPGDAPGIRGREPPDLALGDVQADRGRHLRDPSRRRPALAARHDGQGLAQGPCRSRPAAAPGGSGATCREPSGNSQTSRR